MVGTAWAIVIIVMAIRRGRGRIEQSPTHGYSATREGRDQPGPHRVANRNHDDRDRRRCLLGREAGGGAVGRDDIDRAVDDLRRSFGEPFGHPVAIGVVECDVLAFEVTEIAQLMTEGIPPGGVIDDADTRDLPSLLRVRGKRPRSRSAAERR